MLNISAGTLETEKVHIYSGRCGADTLGDVVHPLTSSAPYLIIRQIELSKNILQALALAYRILVSRMSR